MVDQGHPYRTAVEAAIVSDVGEMDLAAIETAMIKRMESAPVLFRDEEERRFWETMYAACASAPDLNAKQSREWADNAVRARRLRSANLPRK